MIVMSRRTHWLLRIALLLPLAVVTSAASGQAAGQGTTLTTRLSGSEQVPAVQTAGTGQFQGTIVGNKAITYRLTFAGLSSRVTMAHIHLGKRGANGGVIAWLCGGGGKPSCPATGASIRGTITAADVNAVSGPQLAQRVQRGDLPGMIRAILSDNTYVNVHTTKYPGGEIRGQIQTSQPAQALSATTSYVVVDQAPPASGSTPSAPQYQVVTPTPGTGSIVIEQQPPASGSGPSVPQEQIVIPGPNPSQNTGVGLGEQLSAPGNPVTVYPTPGQ